MFWRPNQCESAGDDLALNQLALARNGCGLQVWMELCHRDILYGRSSDKRCFQ